MSDPLKSSSNQARALGLQLRTERRKAFMLLPALADATGLPETRLSAIEAGKVRATAEELSNIMRVLGVEPSSFFDAVNTYLTAPEHEAHCDMFVECLCLLQRVQSRGELPRAWAALKEIDAST